MRHRERDDAEFADFMAARNDQLYRSAYLLTTSPQAAEDLAQGALARAYASWSRVRVAEDPVAYVHRMLINLFLSECRRRSSTERPIAVVPEAVASGPAPEDRLVLMSALATLPDLDRAVVVLRYWEDRSVGETAAALDLTESAVKNRALRSLRALRATLGDLADPAVRGTLR